MAQRPTTPRSGRSGRTASTRGKELARELREAGRLVNAAADIAGDAEHAQESIAGIAESLVMVADAVVDGDHLAAERLEGLAVSEECIGDGEDAADDMTEALEALSARFDTVTAMIDDLMEAITGGEETVERTAGERTAALASIDGCDEQMDRIRTLVEQVDVTALNAALAAGRLGDTGSELAPVADGMQTASRGFTAAADRMIAGIATLRTAAQETFDRRITSLDRVRTVSVTAKGVRNAVTDIIATGNDLVASVETVSDLLEQAAFACAESAPDLEDRHGYLRDAADALEAADALLPGLGEIVSDAADIAADISALVERIADGSADEDTVLDAVDARDELERLTVAASTALTGLDAPRKTLHTLITTPAGDTDQDTAANPTVTLLDDLDTALNTIGDQAGTILVRLGDTGEVFTQIIRECRHLDRESDGFTDRLAEMTTALRRLHRFRTDCTDTAARLDSVSVAGAMACARVGNAADTFIPFLRECTTLSGHIEAASVSLTGHLDTLDDILGDTLRAAVISVGGRVVLVTADLSESFDDAAIVISDAIAEGMSDVRTSVADARGALTEQSETGDTTGTGVTAFETHADACRTSLDGMTRSLADLAGHLDRRLPED